MKVSVRLARVIVTLLILIILIFVGCQRASRSATADNPNVQISLQPAPETGTLVVNLTDSSGTPITDATVALEGNMNHAGMMPVLADAVADNADGKSDGHYTLPFPMAMLGDWIVSVTVNQANGGSFKRDLPVTVSAEGIQGDSVKPLDSAGPPQNASPSSGDDSSNGRAGETTLQIEEPMARPAPLAGGTGALYFVLENQGNSPVTLVGAESPAAGAVELHTTQNDNGVMRMRPVTDGIKIDPGKSVELTPGSMHMMLVDLTAPLMVGDSFDVTLHFDGAPDLTFTAPVVNMDATMNDSTMNDSMDSSMHDGM